MPETLRRDLEAYRLQAAQVEIARHPAIAFDLLVFHVACGVFDHLSPHDGPDVHLPAELRQAERRGGNGRRRAAGSDRRRLPRRNGSRKKTKPPQFDAFRKLTACRKAGHPRLLHGADAQTQARRRRWRRAHRLRHRPVADRRRRGRLLASDQGQLLKPHHPRPVAGDRPRGFRRPMGAVAAARTRKASWSISSTGRSPIPRSTAARPSRSQS